MTPEIHGTLLQHDVRGAWECPPDANWGREIAQLRELIPEIELAIQTPLRLDEGVQDASFFADLGVLVEQHDPNGIIYFSYHVCFRFSWFGHFFSIYGNNVDAYNVEKAIRVLEGRGYSYIPAAELDAPYDGLNEPYEVGLTWWVRYFDYL